MAFGFEGFELDAEKREPRSSGGAVFAHGFVLARASFLANAPELAPIVERILAPVGGHIAVRGVATAHRRVDHALGLLAALRRERDAASSRLARAAPLASRIGAPLWLARIEADRARIGAASIA